uniref:Uncharacterized protein n=1 Tax=Romanomermis culicivorax TaxID=13658 RepID=A0A915JEJ0_ROMCU
MDSRNDRYEVKTSFAATILMITAHNNHEILQLFNVDVVTFKKFYSRCRTLEKWTMREGERFNRNEGVSFKMPRECHDDGLLVGQIHFGVVISAPLSSSLGRATHLGDVHFGS